MHFLWPLSWRYALFLAAAALSVGASSPTRRANDVERVYCEIGALRDLVGRMQIALGNQEADLKICAEKARTGQEATESLCDQIDNLSRQVEGEQRAACRQLAIRLDALEAAQKGIASDFMLIKTHVNESASFLNHCEQRLDSIEAHLQRSEKSLASTQQSLTATQEVLQNLLTAIQGQVQPRKALASTLPQAANSGSGDTTATSSQSDDNSVKYIVKPGDNLEKIAKNHHTTIAAIKTCNNLKSDRIVVGQKLKLP